MSRYQLFLTVLVLSFFFSLHISAQTDIAIGEWKSHLPYFNVDHVEQSDEKVFLATAESVVIYDKGDGSLEFLSKIDGLSETGIQDMVYNEANNQLIIAYTNSVFDIVTEEDVFRISDIKNKTDIVGDKQIYDLYISDNQYLYLATGFGLVQFDLESLEFGFTMDISQKVSVVNGQGDALIIGLSEGAYSINLNETNAPGFFQEWSLLSDGLPSNYVPVDVYMNGGTQYVATDSIVYSASVGDSFVRIFESTFSDFEIRFINSCPQGWLLGMRKLPNDDGSIPGNGKLYLFDNNQNEIAFADNCFRNIEDASMDAAGRVFTTEVWDGIFYRDSFNGPCQELNINSPFARDAVDIAISRGAVYVASGGVRDNFGDEFSRKGFYIRKDGSWTNVNERENNFLKDNNILQIYKTEGSPDGSKIYFGSFWAGLLEYDVETEEMILYNESNSSLENLVGDSRVRISGLAFDRDQNLWISNFGAPQPLAVKTTDGNWYSFEIDNSNKNLTNLAVDDSGLIWGVIGGTQGALVVYDPGENVADPTDDRQNTFNQNNSEIPSNFVNTVKVDRDGAVWVGTGEGAVVFECGSSALDESCTGNRRKVTVDNILANLLESEDVLSIAIDGANRKWFGTRRGIFVQSPDGETQVAKFDVDNSPLFDNVVRAMEFEPTNGEMYIATDKGMQSFRTKATGASNSHASNVVAFPNPVRPDYNGPIAIKGLAQDAEVRITDVDGMLVYKGTALGGQAIWDGQDLKGREVAGGVYLVFTSSTDLFRDISTNVAKILVVR